VPREDGLQSPRPGGSNHRLEAVAATIPLLKLAIVIKDRGWFLRQALRNHHETIGIPVRQWTQQRRVYNAANGRVGANAQQ
jgi:hypothetical protein